MAKKTKTVTERADEAFPVMVRTVIVNALNAAKVSVNPEETLRYVQVAHNAAFLLQTLGQL